MFALILAAFAVGLGNFGVSIGIGLSGADVRTRIRVGVVFGVFESGMPVLGLAAGQQLTHALGRATQYAGGALLIAMGLWTLYQIQRGSGPLAPAADIGRLLLTALALSMDNLVVGFGLGVQDHSLPQAIITFALVSVSLSLLGLEFGRRLGSTIESGAEYLAGGVLVVVGCLIASGLL